MQIFQSLIKIKDNISNKIILYWLFSGLLTLGILIYISIFSHNFSYDFRVIEMPIFKMVALLSTLGGLFTLTYLLIIKSEKAISLHKSILLIIISFGILFRLAMFSSEPMLEDDYQRYLWDGAITANGMNPYKHAPKDYLQNKISSETIEKIKQQAGPVLSRINHSDLRTIYPPVAQGAFAIAYLIEPFSLTSWRIVLFLSDIASLLLLLKILAHFNRSELWVALYWWNPVVIKELFNSTHMEAILIPFLLIAIFLALKKYYTVSGLCLMCAAGIKIWPLALYPIIFRPLLQKPKRLLLTLIPSAILGCFLLWPILITTLDQKSGFVAYATLWKTNSALMPLLTNIYEATLNFLKIETIKTGIAVRLTIILILMSVITYLLLKTEISQKEWFNKIIILIFCIFLLSPAQFPWYYVWVAPFLVFMPISGFLFLTITIQLYYIGFHYMSRDQLYVFNRIIIWIIWIPVWILLIDHFLKRAPIMTKFIENLGKRASHEKR